MGWRKPEPSAVWQAVSSYLAAAYEGPTGPHDLPAGTPSAVRARLDSLRLVAHTDFYDSSVFERDLPGQPTKFSLRLGNKHYPHMKLAILRSPDGRGHLFQADTHDAHCRPAPGSRDYEVFIALMDKNREVAEHIESAWEAKGLPTFKGFLREDLARRRNTPTS
jgi:hypothetical protein